MQQIFQFSMLNVVEEAAHLELFDMDCGTNMDFEREYSPSLYTKRFQNYPKPNEQVLTHFVNVSQEATTLARRLYKTHLDVRYGGETDNQLLDIYYKDEEQCSPIFVYIHGGFWQELDKSTSGPIVHTFVEQNYRVLLVDYDFCPNVTLKQLTQQISNFYKWLKVYAEETRAPKISICGHSAGAHLALQIFDNEFLLPLNRLRLIDHLFLISGLYDLRELWPFQNCNPHNVLALNADLARELSPLCWSYNNELVVEYRKQNLKLHILVAENDSETFKLQSRNYGEKLSALNVNVDYRVFKSYDHFNIIEECSDRNSPISRYMQSEMGILTL